MRTTALLGFAVALAACGGKFVDSDDGSGLDDLLDEAHERTRRSVRHEGE